MSHGPLSAIVYVSAAAQPMTPPALEDLLLEAQHLNLASGVTGVLLYADGTFMQYFEGAPHAVAETYDRIVRSRRHVRLVEMTNGPIAAREFPDWQMALAQPSPSELLALSTAHWVVHKSRSAARSRSSQGMTLLRNFWDRQRPR